MLQIKQSDLSPLKDQFNMIWQHIEEMVLKVNNTNCLFDRYLYLNAYMYIYFSSVKKNIGFQKSCFVLN